ncbi:MAG: DUF4115 domain-containing protein, partial [Chitinispirillaceae bacterium]|nr:DUF4115 domain-containing protein [Chitinispirillaceae bacterium]
SLRLNPLFIEALEANQYDLLPGDAYIRVYLRSITGFLSLNPEEILQRFFNERGVTGVDTLKKDAKTRINVALQETEKPNLTLIITVSAIILLGLLSVIANRQSWFSSSSTIPHTTGDTAVVAPPASPSTAEKLSDTIPAAPVSKSDSTAAVMKTETGHAAAVHAADNKQAPIAAKADSAKEVKSPAAGSPGRMTLVVTMVGDSSWLLISADGQRWRSTLHKGHKKVLAAHDSFNVHVGINSAVKFTLNGQPLVVPGNGIVSFRLDHSGLHPWTPAGAPTQP